MNVQMDSTGFSKKDREILSLERINLHIEKNYFALLQLSTIWVVKWLKNNEKLESDNLSKGAQNQTFSASGITDILDAD